MAEPEELLGDVARIAVEHVRGRWRSRRAAPAAAGLDAFAPGLELLLLAVTGRVFPLRPAAPPLPPTLLARVFGQAARPRSMAPLPATDGTTIWLPPTLPADVAAAPLYRAMALQQAVKAMRGSPLAAQDAASPLLRDLVLLLETLAADAWLAAQLPGTADTLVALRAQALQRRPAREHFAGPARVLEDWVRAALARPPRAAPPCLPLPATAAASLQAAATLAASFVARERGTPDATRLHADWWTGRLDAPAAALGDGASEAVPVAADLPSPRSGRLRRPPRVRAAMPDEDRDGEPGAWTVQLDTPHEHAEDPRGLERPTDRDDRADAAELADAVSELDAARLVSAPGRAHEVLLSDLVLPPQGRSAAATNGVDGAARHYPEWDYRAGVYRVPGATVLTTLGEAGDDAWVARTLDAYRAQLAPLRRRFEQLRARRIALRRQLDGTEPDIDACIAARADARAGLPHAQGLYLQLRPARRDMAVLILTDVSGSTEAWLAGERRVIDVEREALLLVCVALEALGEPYSVLAFSGETAQGVEVRTLKRFDERGAGDAWRRIAALAPERYTRVGAALRHATAELRRQRATHRLLLLLSDGKPNDVDEYDGPYGVHDLRQAVNEARASGIHPFCLAVDREAAAWLRAVFGGGGYALLQQPARLPTVLLDWLRRLVAG